MERWIAKERLDGKSFDVRLLAVNGSACHAVLRLSSSPITNLHLRNERRPLDEGMIASGVAEAGYTQYSMRHYLLKAILHREGLELAAYAERFGREAMRQHPELEQLLRLGLAELEAGVLRLTALGMAYSDALGDELISADVRERMEGYELR
ncbi:hypothetical protein P4K96_24600 [Bacillus cereus]|nr:hypothetical protein [Bacillus cereus]